MRPRAENAFHRLYEVAEAQQGFFTAKQAKAAGFAENTHPYHVRAEHWTREHRGIYRLVHFPRTDHPDLALWSLWSQNRNEQIEGVYSHQTALSLHELSDINPAKLHMTVPPHFRRNSRIPEILVLHRGELRPPDIQVAQGFRYTRPLRSILDLVDAGTVEQSILRQAAQQALERGLITCAELKKANLTAAAANLFARASRKSAR